MRTAVRGPQNMISVAGVELGSPCRFFRAVFCSQDPRLLRSIYLERRESNRGSLQQLWVAIGRKKRVLNPVVSARLNATSRPDEAMVLSARRQRGRHGQGDQLLRHA
jgi:hypothetical protein